MGASRRLGSLAGPVAMLPLRLQCLVLPPAQLKIVRPSADRRGVAQALRNPRRGVVEAAEIDHRELMELALPDLGDPVGVWSDWTPLQDRSALFAEPRDPDDPWQFLHLRVT
jgi:homospermidine synthase